MTKSSRRSTTIEDAEAFTPPVHLCIDKGRLYTPQSGDSIAIYGPGKLVLERNGHIVAIADSIVWKRPAMICPLRPTRVKRGTDRS